MKETDIRSGLLKSKYYIKGKAEEKFLAPKGGHRIGIGTDWPSWNSRFKG